MDFFKNITKDLNKLEETHTEDQKHGGGGELINELGDALGGHHNKQPEEKHGAGGLLGHLNSALGGGERGEKKEDGLDKAVDWVQEHVLKEGQQSNETAAEEAKDEVISDTIRTEFKKVTGKDFFIPDKS